MDLLQTVKDEKWLFNLVFTIVLHITCVSLKSQYLAAMHIVDDIPAYSVRWIQRDVYDFCAIEAL